MDGSSSPNKFFSKALLPPVGVGSLLIIFNVTGFSEFFISFGISPIGALASLLGMVSLPVVVSYFIAKLLYKKEGISFDPSWLVGTVIICLVMAIGSAKGS